MTEISLYAFYYNLKKTIKNDHFYNLIKTFLVDKKNLNLVSYVKPFEIKN